ncbi:Putative ribonuclease H protein At1g65750, partial [Linum perenne]
LNTDGSVLPGSGSAAAGGVVRDELGRCSSAFSVNLGRCSVTRAELRGMIVGLDVVWETGIRRVVVQTDYMVAMTLIKGTRAMCHQHAGEVSTIRMILQHDWEVTISHIYRKGIKVADYLAWIASGYPFNPLFGQYSWFFFDIIV